MTERVQRNGSSAPSATMSTVTTTPADVVEQVMRVTCDDLDVLPFLDAPAGSRRALSALGRLIAATSMELVPGCPVVSWATGSPADHAWRPAYPARPGSLWEHLEFLASLYGHVQAPNPYEELEGLRAHESHDGF